MTASSEVRLRRLLFWLGVFCAPIALMCLVAAWGGVHPFGPESFLTEDLKYQYIDFFTWFRGVLLGENNLLYSFSLSLGSNMWGLYGYYLGSPLNLLVVFFDEAHLVDFVFLTTMAKLGLISVSCAWFLRRRFDVGRSWAFVLALSFSMCSWVVTQLRNPMWLDALALLPLAAWLCHRLIFEGRFVALGVVVAADVSFCWYAAYMSILFLCVFVLYELACYAWEGEGRSVSPSFVAGRAARFAAAMVLGLLLSAWTFLPSVLVAMNAGGAAQDMSTELLTCWKRDIVRGFLPFSWRSAYPPVPQLYAGVASLVMASLFALASRERVRLRVAAFALGFVAVASAVVTPVQFVWCGFREPNGFYARTGFLTAFVLVYLAGAWLASRKRGHIEREVSDGSGTERHEGGGRHLSHVTPAVRRALMVAVCVGTCAELVVSAHLAWDQLYWGYPQATHDAYLSDAEEQLLEVEGIEDSTFFRMDKSVPRTGASLNEGLAAGYRQLSSYTSSTSTASVAFMNSCGYSSEGTFSTRWSGPNLVMDSLLGLRYGATTSRPAGYEDAGLTPVDNGTRLWRNPYALPLGYAVDEDAASATIEGFDDPFERQNAVASALAGREIRLFSPCVAHEVAPTTEGARSWEVEVPAGSLGFAYVVCGPKAGLGDIVALSIDGGPTMAEGWRFDHSVRPLSDDIEDAAATHAVTLSPANAGGELPEGETCVFYALDVAVFESLMEEFAASPLELAEVSDGHLAGTIEADQNHDLLLTIPYDAGWTVRVDGCEVEAKPAFEGALTVIPVEAGKNVIEMDFVPQGLVVGCCMTGATVACLVIARLVHRRGTRTKP